MDDAQDDVPLVDVANQNVINDLAQEEQIVAQEDPSTLNVTSLAVAIMEEDLVVTPNFTQTQTELTKDILNFDFPGLEGKTKIIMQMQK